MTALVERLREELAGRRERRARAAAGGCSRRATGPSASGRSPPSGRSSGDPGCEGVAAAPVKRLLRPFMRWYVEPLAAEQRVFNDAGPEAGGRALEELDRARRRRESAGALARGARGAAGRAPSGATAGAAPATVAAQPAAASRPGLLRVRDEDARLDDGRARAPARLRRRLPRRRAGARRRLRPRRVPRPAARGGHRGARRRRRRRHGRLRARRGPRRRAGRRARLPRGASPTARSAGSSPAQVVEHLPPAALFRLLELAAAKLRPGGLLVAETINPLSPLALRTYFADLTHAQPLVPETLALLARQAGFARSRPAS